MLYEFGPFRLDGAERDAAFRCFGEACAQGESWAAFLAVDPRLDSLRDDPRYSGLVERLRRSA